jgi:rRNA maturation RNase YbeY
MGSKSKVYFFFDNVHIALRDRTKLKKAIEHIFKSEKKPLNRLNYVFCSDKKLLDINRQYLKHDYYTDIITFDFSTKSSPVIGEIYISVNRIKENARKFSHSIGSELHRVIFHGALHLCGFKDKRKKERDKMRRKEEFYLNKYLK